MWTGVTKGVWSFVMSVVILCVFNNLFRWFSMKQSWREPSLFWIMDAIKKHLIFFPSCLSDSSESLFQVNFGCCTENWGKKKRIWGCLYSQEPPSDFPSKILAITPQTITSTPSCFAPQPVFAAAAYCLSPAGRPAILVLRFPAAPANRPVLLKLSHSHLQSSYRNER